MGKTSIQWAAGSNDGREGHSINPFRAENVYGATGHHCVKISSGCKNCYSSRLQSRFKMPDFTAGNIDRVGVFLDESKLHEVLRRKKPTGYFWCDMTDMFLDAYPFEWIDKCFAVMALTPQHIHMILTKRPERMREYMDRATPNGIDDVLVLLGVEARREFEWPLPNCSLGVSVEDQERADERIPPLLQIPAAVRFVSYEPALGPVDFSCWFPHEHAEYPREKVCKVCGVQTTALHHPYGKSLLDWVIVGGESGPGARPFNTQWARDVIAQCKAAGVACFVKQVGSNPQWATMGVDNLYLPRDRKGGDPSEWPADLRVREYPA